MTTATAIANPNLASSNIQQGNSIELTARLILGQGISLAEVLFAGKIGTKQIT